MSDSVIGSKEVAMFIIAVLLQQGVAYTGVAFPLDATQIYAACFAIAMMIRVFWTKEKITSIMP